MVEYACYPVAFDRAKAYIMPGDIPDIAALFEKDYGYPPIKFYINPKMKKYIDTETPEIVEHPGVATWEIWSELKDKANNVSIILDDDVDISEISPTIENNVSIITDTENSLKSIIKQQDAAIKPLTVVSGKRGRGRPRKTGEISRITAWRRKKESQGVLL